MTCVSSVVLGNSTDERARSGCHLCSSRENDIMEEINQVSKKRDGHVLARPAPWLRSLNALGCYAWEICLKSVSEKSHPTDGKVSEKSHVIVVTQSPLFVTCAHLYISYFPVLIL